MTKSTNHGAVESHVTAAHRHRDIVKTSQIVSGTNSPATEPGTGELRLGSPGAGYRCGRSDAFSESHGRK